MTIIAPNTFLPSFIAALRAAFSRRRRAPTSASPDLATGPDIPLIPDRHAPTWQNDLPFFLQQGWGHPDRD